MRFAIDPLPLVASFAKPLVWGFALCWGFGLGSDTYAIPMVEAQPHPAFGLLRLFAFAVLAGLMTAGPFIGVIAVLVGIFNAVFRNAAFLKRWPRIRFLPGLIVSFVLGLILGLIEAWAPSGLATHFFL